GLCWLRTGELSRARVALLRVVDRAPGDELAAIAWWYVARTHLDVGDVALAQRPLRRAAAGPNPHVAAAAALGLSACHLLDGHDTEVHDDLARAPRMALKSDVVRPDATLLDALARFRLA